MKFPSNLWLETFWRLLLCANFCLARWEKSFESVCDENGCIYAVRIGDIVDRIPHNIFFEWEWNGKYSVNLDDTSNTFKYGHEICIDVDGCNGTLICAQVNELTQSDDRTWVELVVSGRVEAEKENIYAEQDMKFRFLATETQVKIPQDIENFLVELGY